MMQALIREAREDELPHLLRIYNHYVETSHCTFDVDALTLEQRRGWFEGFAPEGPHRLLVAECPEPDPDEAADLVSAAGTPVGYITSRPFRAKPAYRTSVETTVYVDPAFTGRGVGRRLYESLLAALEQEPVAHRAYAGIALPNDASIALHVGLGYQLVGTFRQVGHKFGRFWDVSWYERDLFTDC